MTSQEKHYREVKGHKYARGFNEENILSGLSYQPRADDLFIVTFPKTGTTWMQQIVTLILHEGNVPEIVKKEGMGAVSPFLEASGKEKAEVMKRPGSIKTHMPFHVQPKHPDAKYIIVIRNPKDACVSFYYHHKRHASYCFQDRNFHDFFRFWIDGEVEGGSYFDWYLSWWNQRDNYKILWLLYEDMKTKPEESILKVAKFIGKEYEDNLIANNNEILKQVVEKSSFDFMQKNWNDPPPPKKKDDDEREGKPKPDDTIKHIRKGIIGDWTTHFTPQENQEIEKLFFERFAGTQLEEMWKDYDIFSK